MTSSFSALKKARSSSLDKLTKKLEQANSGGYSNPEEDQYWQPTVDSAGNGSAIIRFLPEPENEDDPFVRLWSHGFKGPTGRWYIENCLSTLGQPDPVNDLNNTLWNSGAEEDKKTARAQKRKLHYISNIYVVRDPGKPESEGKVFKYKYGKKIFDKLQEAMRPTSELDTPINPFDMWEGANFRIKIKKVDGYRNYDSSSFDSPEALLGGDDDKLEEVYKKMYSLKDIVSEKNFKSYDELKAKLDAVLGLTASAPASASAAAIAEAEEPVSRDFDLSDLGSKSKDVDDEKIGRVTESKASVSSDDEDEDSDLEFFRSMAAED